MAWWTHDSFGMFIHWGVYVRARHEWVKPYEKITTGELNGLKGMEKNSLGDLPDFFRFLGILPG